MSSATINPQCIATVFGDAYSKSAPKILGDQHAYLRETIESRLGRHPNPTLLVLGPGGQVLPHSCTYSKEGKLDDTNRDKMLEILKTGRMILADYVVNSNKNGLAKGLSTLASMGFFDEGYFLPGQFNPSGILKSRNLESKTISFLKNNLRENLRIEDNLADFVDANLSIHHASITRKELDRVYSEIYRVLKPNGMLHLGEGEVDMNYTEDKLIKIGQGLSEILGEDILLSDEREKASGYVVNSLFKRGKQYSELPVVDETVNSPRIIKIDNDGDVRGVMFNAKDFLDFTSSFNRITDQISNICLARKYGGGILGSSGPTNVSFKLIDSKLDDDREKFVKQVDGYYDAIKQRAIDGYAVSDPDIAEEICNGVEFERNNARRGLVEYYMGEDKIVSALKNAGFAEINVKHHERGPFYNITAVKPTCSGGKQ